MPITVLPIPAFDDEEPIEEVRVRTRLRYIACNDEVWEEEHELMHVAPAGKTWHERVTWNAKRSLWSIELLDNQDVKYAQQNVAVPDRVGDEMAEPFQSQPEDCPKCGGESRIDRYVIGIPHRDARGAFSVTRLASSSEHLVVQCRSCGFERLMEVGP